MNAPSSLHALAILLTIVAILIAVWSGQRKNVAPIITIAMVVHCVLWYLAPLITQLFLAQPPANSPGPATRDELAVLSSAMLVAVVVTYLGLRRPHFTPVVEFFDQTAPPLRRLFWPTAVVFVALLAIERSINAVAGSSFAEGVVFGATATNSDRAITGVAGTLEGIFLGYAVAVISLGRGSVTRGTMIMAWMSVVAFCGFVMMRGSRSIGLLPIALGVIAISSLQGRARRRAIVMLGVGGAVLLAVGAPLAAVMGVARTTSAGLSVQMLEDAYEIAIRQQSFDAQIQLFAEEFNRKFDAVGPAVELLAMEPPGSAGVQPILSASLSPVPRALYLEKPVPISKDGTTLGVPYRIAAKAYGDADIGMVVPVSAPAIALWEFGGIGLLLMLAMNIFNLVLLNTVFISRNVLARALGVSLLGFPTCEYFVGPHSLILQNDLRVMMLLTALGVALLAWRMLSGASSKARAAVVAAPTSRSLSTTG